MGYTKETGGCSRSIFFKCDVTGNFSAYSFDACNRQLLPYHALSLSACGKDALCSNPYCAATTVDVDILCVCTFSPM